MSFNLNLLFYILSYSPAFVKMTACKDYISVYYRLNVLTEKSIKKNLSNEIKMNYFLMLSKIEKDVIDMAEISAGLLMYSVNGDKLKIFWFIPAVLFS